MISTRRDDRAERAAALADTGHAAPHTFCGLRCEVAKSNGRCTVRTLAVYCFSAGGCRVSCGAVVLCVNADESRNSELQKVRYGCAVHDDMLSVGGRPRQWEELCPEGEGYYKQLGSLMGVIARRRV